MALSSLGTLKWKIGLNDDYCRHPEELAARLGSRATVISREGWGLAALKEGLWTEAELGRFLGLPRLALEHFLKDHGVELPYTWDDLERERELYRSSRRGYLEVALN